MKLMHQPLATKKSSVASRGNAPRAYVGNAESLAGEIARTHGTPALILDCDMVRSTYAALARALPAATLHYAVKALPDPVFIQTLHGLGASFEVASTGELALLKRLDVPTSECIHTHPVKRPADIAVGLDASVSHFVFDCLGELDKLAAFAPGHRVLLRVGYGHADAMVQLANKFGCHPEEANALICAARERGLRPDGICFHVGSQSPDSSAHVAAIHASEEFFSRHSDMSILDIGGGFPVPYDAPVPDIESFCAPIREALACIPARVRVIAEPGRYLAAPCLTAVAAVMGTSERAGKRWYFLDDGVYGSFSGRIFDHARYPLQALGAHSGTRHSCVVAGPTCDGLDVIDEDASLPAMETGDLVVAKMMGAYTIASASQFNGFPVATLVPINEAPVRSVDRGCALGSQP